ncbi:MAG: BlaI/MecI/CopY family transcriptional regulator [Oscillospiraceae bacterium]|nr:BlaI/MecI/CopY family transcriptional regulator [Oscillospiraceae bacterium]
MKNPLSPNEFKIMQLLWKEDRPLSRPEIIEMIPDRDWNPNSIHLILNNMIEKGVICVDGMTRCGRGYGRTYAATLSNLEYAVRLLKDATPELPADERALGVMRIMLRDGLSPQTLESMRGLLEA